MLQPEHIRVAKALRFLQETKLWSKLAKFEVKQLASCACLPKAEDKVEKAKWVVRSLGRYQAMKVGPVFVLITIVQQY